MSSALEPKRILLVEDDEDTAELLAESLEERGHLVRVARDGRSALSIAREHQPDAAILDLGLPDMDGFQLARALRQVPELAGLFLIALTGYSSDEDRRQAREAGFDAHIVKPVLPRTLAQAIERCEKRGASSTDSAQNADSRSRAGHDLA